MMPLNQRLNATYSHSHNWFLRVCVCVCVLNYDKSHLAQRGCILCHHSISRAQKETEQVWK